MKLKTINTVLSHPLNRSNKINSLMNLFRRAIVVRLCPHPIVYPFIEGTKLLVSKGMSSAELQIYSGLYELSEMTFTINLLNEEDTFVDVGANVGVYTVLASGIKHCKSIAFEPIPETFQHLKNNIQINQIGEKTTLHNMGISDNAGFLTFTAGSESSVNHVKTEGDNNNEVIKVPVDSLDALLENENPILLKVDVEGFETKVIQGATNTLKKSSLKAIIIELNGLANSYGFDEAKIHETLLQNGFQPYQYNAFNRSLSQLSGHGNQNTIYLRDLEFVKARILNAPKINVGKRQF